MGEGSTRSWEEGVSVHGRRECQFMAEGSTSSWEEGGANQGSHYATSKLYDHKA